MNLKDKKNGEMKMPEESFGNLGTKESTSYLGMVLGILIVVLILILGGLYIWGETIQKQLSPSTEVQVERPTAEENNEPESTNAEADVEILETTSTSDEITSIEADLGSTNLDTLDSDLTAIDAELE